MAIRSAGHSFLIGGSEGDLLRLSAGIALAPQVPVTANLNGEIHPVSARGPYRGEARAGGPDGNAGGAAVEWHQATTPIGRSVHPDNQHAFSIGRQIAIVRHSAFVTWQINFAQ